MPAATPTDDRTKHDSIVATLRDLAGTDDLTTISQRHAERLIDAEKKRRTLAGDTQLPSYFTIRNVRAAVSEATESRPDDPLAGLLHDTGGTE